MTILDGDIGNVIKCDRCGKIHDFENSDWQIKQHLWWKIFDGRRKPDVFGQDFCIQCAETVTPLIYKLRDIDELTFFNNKLLKAINEKSKQRNTNNRPTQNNACKCCERCSEWRSGYRSCDSFAQAGEEHF